MTRQRRQSDLHRLAEERSIAYHRVIAERLRRDPAVLDVARARVQRWIETSDPVPEYARAWGEVLSQDAASIAAFLINPDERARELRQSSPFAGCLSPQERWQLWRETRVSSERAE